MERPESTARVRCAVPSKPVRNHQASRHSPAASAPQQPGQTLIQKISEYGKKFSCKRGHIFFLQGQRARSVFLLKQGSVKLSIDSRDGNSLILGFLGPGTVLGLAANILGHVHETSAEAVLPSIVVELPRESFQRLADRDSRTAREVADLLTVELFKLLDLVRIIGLSDSACQRLAAFLLTLRNTDGCRNGTRNELARMTESDLGQMTGLCRETVSRLLSRLTRMGALSKRHSAVVIRDWKVLENLAREPAVRAK